VRKIEDASDIGVGSYIATILGVAMDHEIQRTVILHLGVDLERAQYDSDAETFITGRIGVLWLVSKNFRVNGTLSLSDHQSSLATPYSENVFLLSVTAGI
jgi:hypothetical protein